MWLGLQSLEVLNLRYNEIRKLPPRCFYGLSKLEDLWLSHNEISSITSETFEGLISLKTLRLHWNQISSISRDVFIWNDMQVALGDNPLDCDERSFWMKKAEEDGRLTFLTTRRDESPPSCANQDALSGKL